MKVKEANVRPGTLLRWYALKRILVSEIRNGTMVLDIGGYDGYISYSLKRLLPNIKIVIVDINEKGLRLARKRGLTVLCDSAIKLSFVPDNSIDVVLCLDLIEHVEEDDLVFKEIARVLKKDGKIILTTPMQKGISFPFLSREKIKYVNKSWGHIRMGYSLLDIIKLFRKNNLTVISSNRYCNFISRLIYRVSVLSKISIIAKITFMGKNPLYNFIIRFEPFIKIGAQAHIIVGKK